MMGLPFL